MRLLVRCVSIVLLLIVIGQPSEQSLFAQQQRYYIIPDVCAPGMGTYIEIIGDHTLRKQFGEDGIYPNNLGDDVRVVLDRPEDSTKVLIGPVSVAWDGRMISTHIFVLPNVAPNDTYWNNLRDEFRIPISVVLKGQTTPALTDTIFIVRPFTSIAECSAPVGQDSVVIGVTGTGMERRVLRSKRGALVVENVALERGKKYGVATDDTDNLAIGNQGYLPFVLTVRGTFEGNGASINVSGVGKNAGPGGGGGGGQVCDGPGISGNANHVGGNGFTGGAGGGVNNAGNPFSGSSWLRGGGGAGQNFASPELPGNRNTIEQDGGFSLNGVPGGLSKNNDSEHPQSTGGGTGHPFGRAGWGWNGNEARPTAGGGNGRKEDMNGDWGGYGLPGVTSDLDAANIGGGVHGNIAIVPIAGGSGGASGNPQGIGACGGIGGGGGGAIRIIAQSVKNVNLFAQGSQGANGTRAFGYQGPRGGDGSGGHIAVMAKMPMTAIQANVTSPSDPNRGGGRMRFDAPSGFDGVRVFPEAGPSYRAYSGVCLDTMNLLQSPYSRPIRIGGFIGDAITVRFFYRTTTSTWQQFDTSATSGPTSSSNVPIAFTRTIPPPRMRAGEQDSLVFVVAAEEFSITNNPDQPPYLINPKWVMSPAASNVLRVPPLPFIEVNVPNGNTVNFPTITRCENDTTSTSITVTVRNRRGGLLNIREVRFTGSLAPFLTATPSTAMVVQNDSIRLTITLRATPALRADISNFQGEMQIFHNDTLPDVGGALRPSPWRIGLAAQINTTRYDVRSVNGSTYTFQNNVLDFGRIGVGDIVRDTIRIVNVASPRTTFRYLTRAGVQPLRSTPFDFEEIVSERESGTIVLPVSFSPTTIGAATLQTLVITLRNGSASCPFATELRITLRGTGVQPRLDEANSTRSLDLGTLTRCFPNTVETSASVVVFNSGNDSLQVRSIRMATTTSSFSPSVNNLDVPVNMGRTFTLRFTAPAVTLATATLRDTVLLTTNDARYGQSMPYPIPVQLTLKTFNPSVRLIPAGSVMAFGNARYFIRQQRTATLANNGNVPVTVQISSLRTPFRLLAPTQSLFTLAPGATQAITVEIFVSENEKEGVVLRDVLTFTLMPEDGQQCPLTLAPLEITATPQGPAGMVATMWLDTLSGVDMRRDTVLRLWGRVQTGIAGRTDNLRAGILVQRGMFFPTAVRSSFGTASLVSTTVQGRDRAIVVSVANVALTESPTVIAEIRGTPILTDTMWANLLWLPQETRWSRGDSVYTIDSLRSGFMATFVPILRTQPRLTSGPIVGQIPRQRLITSVQPNPVRDELTVGIATREQGEYVLHIVNMLGSRIITHSWKKEADSENGGLSNANDLTTLHFDVRGLPSSGAYLLRVIAPSGVAETFVLGVER